MNFCYECSKYPCNHIERIDKRYRENYGMSMKDNLKFIQEKGIGKFIENQYKKYRCPKCNELISVHNKRCFNCDKISKMIEKDA
jgi:hypothetical protein